MMKISLRYLIYGAAFGLLFPVFSSILLCIQEHAAVSINCLLTVQSTNELLWIIDTAPFFLGGFAFFVGRKQEAINQINEGLQQQVREQTKYLEDTNAELKGEIELRKAREHELIDAREAAEEGVRIKDQFLSNMSHEIRTPMNGILGMTNILLNTELDESQSNYLAAIDYSAKNLLVIINDILDLSKINAEKLQLEVANFSISDVFKSVEQTLRFKAQEKGIGFDIYLDSSLPKVVAGDPVRFGQVLLNIIGNAVKFTLRGKVVVHCLVKQMKEDKYIIEVTVDDTGIGISREDIDRIFESFSQAGNTNTSTFGGTGLGLPISKKLIELHHGDIRVMSDLGKGSQFSFTLELSPPVAERQEVQKNDQVFMTLEKRAQVKILLVEDNQINQMVAQNLLVNYGFQLDIANDGLEAIERVKTKNYDIILMDVQMPEMNGLDATRYIRSHFSAPKCNVKIMAMTASVLKQEIDVCIEAGMDDYLPKPYEPEELYQKIIRLVG